MVGEFGEGEEKVVYLDAIEAGEDLTDFALSGGAVDLLDDFGEFTAGAADDAAIAGGVVENGGGHAGVGAFVAVGLEERF